MVPPEKWCHPRGKWQVNKSGAIHVASGKSTKVVPSTWQVAK